MNYEEARTYLNQASKKGIVLGLQVMEELMNRLGNPQNSLRIVHIAGTNGKGSILAYIEQIFRASGYHTARYVSPALGAYENRFLLDGEGVAKDKIPGLVEQVKLAADRMEKELGLSPTLFEIETAMAFLCFKEAGSQLVLLETGMGGRLDATNVVETPLLSVIASVSLDHMHVLGNTMAEIAAEKAGIIKEGCDVLIYPENPEEVKDVISQVCREKNAAFYEAADSLKIINETVNGSLFSYGRYKKLEIFLPGKHQIYNAITAVQAVELLKKWYCVSEFHVEEGLRRTRWSGRLEKIKENPAVYLDGAHNRDAAKRLAEFVEKHFAGRRILAVVGVLADKEYDKMMEYVLPFVTKTAVITPDNPRALPGKVLLETVKKYCPDAVDLGDIENGLAWAQKEAEKEDVILVFGSLSFLDRIGGQHGKI